MTTPESFSAPPAPAHGGDRIGLALAREGVRFLYTLCGGHIAPILVGAKRAGIRVIDVRDEASAVFAADATARLTGVPGVAAVTAGPGVTNALTALKNAQLAEVPLLLIGGATGTLLRGRGALQDIDQLTLLDSAVKWLGSCERVRELAPAVHQGFTIARAAVPGPVFLETPVDLLYGEELVRDWYRAAAGKGRDWKSRLLGTYLGRHADRLFRGAGAKEGAPRRPAVPVPSRARLGRAATLLAKAERPVLVVGSQAVATFGEVPRIAAAVEALGIPVYLAGGARGLLGARHALQLRHKRKEALREADLVILAGQPIDFRLDYGRQIGRGAKLVAMARSTEGYAKNRRPTLTIEGDAGLALLDLAEATGPAGRTRWGAWLGQLRARDDERERQIDESAAERLPVGVNPLRLCREIDKALPDDSVLVADGGDFIATAAYSIAPRKPLSWLDPGVFGTLGVGGGFALAASLCRPASEVWLLWGDGSCAFSLAEFDTMARHGAPVLAIVGNDASWSQIAREQVE
ncbi:MAG TPA: thiamine pyrophosphate-binding protein, partial [Thermoanaerobaculia bacterium]|nr:thiamine pyrophosphate-binding protein [Thermoanaerobaculia bacterium]